MTPRGAREDSDTRAGILGCNAVEVGTKPGQVDARSATENCDGRVGTHEPVASKWGDLPDGHAMPGDDERLTPVQSPHDLAAVVPELTLGDVSSHEVIVAPCATALATDACSSSLRSCQTMGPSSTDGRAADFGGAVGVVSPKVHLPEQTRTPSRASDFHPSSTHTVQGRHVMNGKRVTKRASELLSHALRQCSKAGLGVRMRGRRGTSDLGSGSGRG